MKRVGVLSSGRGSNFEALVHATREPGFPAQIACLISDREDAPVLELARALEVPAYFVFPGRKKTVLSPDAETEVIGILKSEGCDIVCLAGFMRIVKRGLLESFPGRILNIHPSLLPAFPGLQAQRQAWNYGVKVAGCTVHVVDEGVDTGPIIIQRSVPVEGVTSSEELAALILKEEHVAYPEALRLLAAGRLRREDRRVILLTPEEGRNWEP